MSDTDRMTAIRDAAIRLAGKQSWRDVTLAANGARGLSSSNVARREAERTGAAIGPEPARQFLDALIVALASMDINANPRLSLENLALAMPVPSAGRRQASARH